MIVDATRLLAGRRRAPAHDTGASTCIPLGATADGGVVCWPLASPERASHVPCLAASGTGKTILIARTLLAEFCQSIAQDEEPLAIMAVDPKGDLIAAVLAGLAAQAPELLPRVRYLNPFTVASGGGFPFNVCRLALGTTPVDVRAMALGGLCAAVSTGRGTQAHLGVGARQVELLESLHAAALGVPDPRASVLLALDALTRPQGMRRLAALTTHARARQALEGAHVSDELRSSCAARLRMAYAATEDLERIVAADSCVQFTNLLAPGALTLVDLGQPTGGLLALSEVWASLLVRLAVEFLLERPSPWSGHHVRLVLDEVHLVAAALAEVAEVLLTTGRSRGVSVVALAQGTVLLKDAAPTLLPVLLTNSAMKLVGRLAAPDAELLAREQAPGPGVESSRGEVRDRFIAQATNLPDRDFFALTPGGRQRFRSEDVDLDAWRTRAAAQADVIGQVKRQHALPQGIARRVTLDDLAPAPERGRRGAAVRDVPASRHVRGRTRWG